MVDKKWKEIAKMNEGTRVATMEMTASSAKTRVLAVASEHS